MSDSNEDGLDTEIQVGRSDKAATSSATATTATTGSATGTPVTSTTGTTTVNTTAASSLTAPSTSTAAQRRRVDPDGVKEGEIIILPNGQEMNSKTTLQSFDNPVPRAVVARQVRKRNSATTRAILATDESVTSTSETVLPSAIATSASLISNRAIISRRANRSNDDGLTPIPSAVNFAVAVNSNDIVEAEPYNSVVGTQQHQDIPWYKKKWFYINIIAIVLVGALSGLGVYLATSGNGPTPITNQPTSSPNTPSPTFIGSNKTTELPVQSPVTVLAPSQQPTTPSSPPFSVAPTNVLSKEERLSNYINSITLTERKNISLNGKSPEDIALKWIINTDPVFNTSDSWLSISASSRTDNTTAITSAAQFRLVQRYALLTLWFQQIDSNGRFEQSWNNITGWTRDSDECNWYGIICTTIDFGENVGEQNAVTGIDFPSNVTYSEEFEGEPYEILEGVNLTGTISPELGLLTDLLHFNTTGNYLLSGSLPTSIGQWTALTYFNVQECYFSGVLPFTVGQWTALIYFNTDGNYGMLGTLPSAIGQWTDLTYFNVNFCSFEASLPDEIIQWTAMKYFDVYLNSLSGALPSLIGQWTDLTYFDASYNSFAGTLTLGQWTALRHFDSGSYGFTSILPSSVGQWTMLTYFAANLYETPPPTVGQWTALKSISLSFNLFTSLQPLPSTIGQWVALESFIVTFGPSIPLPTTIGQWKALKHFDLLYTSISGSLPSIIGQWTALTYFNVEATQITGSLPTSIGNWTALTYFSVEENLITGSLPTSIGNWTALTYFNVEKNSISGSLPSTIGNWIALTTFAIENNDFTGIIPSSIGQWNMIVEADFRRNNFIGTMPSGICTYRENGELNKLEADCISEISCTCCTTCT